MIISAIPSTDKIVLPASEFTTVSETRVATWDSIGTSVSTCRNLDQVLAASGLDYEVVAMPTFIADGTRIPNRFVTARPQGDGLRLYDVISDKFEIIQNREAFDFVNYMGEDLEFVKAGETASGVVYIIGKLPEVNILGDTFTPYVLFRNGFTGKVKITAAICPLRIVCQNQFNVSFQNTQNTVTVRHVQNAERKLEEAREVLKMSADYMAELSAMAERYAGTQLTETQVEWAMKVMFPTDGIENMNPFKRKTLEDALNQFKNAYLADDNTDFRGTAWGLINAYTDFITHQVPQGKTSTRFEGKFMKVTFGQPINKIIDIINNIAA